MLLQRPFWRGVLAIAVGMAPALLACAQTERTPIFRAESNEVQVVVIVRDGNGRVVSKLKQNDFTILDDGKPQVIRSFSIQPSGSQTEPQQRSESGSASSTASKAPLQRRFIGLFFDDVNTQPGDFSRVQKAGKQFVQQDLQAEDRVAIFKASENSTEATFSNNTSKLLAEIEALTIHPLGFQGRTSDCPKLSAYEAWVVRQGTDPEALQVLMNRIARCYCPPPASSCTPPPPEALRNMAQASAEDAWSKARFGSETVLASLDSAVHLLATMPGPRVLVLASSGFLTGDLERDVNIVIDNALRGGVSVNALSAKGLATEAPDQNTNLHRQDYSTQEQIYEHQEIVTRAMAEEAAMTDVTESTGGKFFRNNNDLLGGFSALAAPETAYVLSFSPVPLKHDGKFHKLKVEIKAPGHFAIEARKGYFALTEKQAEAAVQPSAPVPSKTPEQPAAANGTSQAAPQAIAPVPAPDTPIAKTEDSKAIATEPAKVLNTAEVGSAAALASAPAPPLPMASKNSTAAESARDFLTRGSTEVERYILRFSDLTADEVREMETFGPGGHVNQKRTIHSELVVYRLRSDPRLVIEFRDVTSIDGKDIKGHAERATRIWTQVAKARNPQEELKLIRQDSERYDIGLEETGFTLYEGLPIRQTCAGAFVFAELKPGSENGRSTRIFNYAQKTACDVISYHLGLPQPLASVPLVHAGQLVLDANTAQIIREERNVYLGNLKGQRVAHLVLDYTGSPFGLLVPKTIVIELFGPPEQVSNPLYMSSMSNATPNGGEAPGPPPGAADEVQSRARFVLHARMVQTYGPFSRFEVDVVQKVSAPAR